MKVSSQGRALIEQREGKRLAAYRDSRGILTVGVGHTGRMAPPAVSAGMRISEAQCDAFLAADLAPVEQVINAVVTVPMTQNEFDALASLGFNIGAGGLRKCLAVHRLNLGDVEGAAAAFMDWAHPAELAGRRREEMAQFLEADPIGDQVVADRAAVLTHKAAASKAKARKTIAGGSAVAMAGATAAVVAPIVHHGHLGWWIGGLAATGAAIDAVVAWTRHGTARTLATNAVMQATPAGSVPAALLAPLDAQPLTKA